MNMPGVLTDTVHPGVHPHRAAALHEGLQLPEAVCRVDRALRCHLSHHVRQVLRAVLQEAQEQVPDPAAAPAPAPAQQRLFQQETTADQWHQGGLTQPPQYHPACFINFVIVASSHC